MSASIQTSMKGRFLIATVIVACLLTVVAGQQRDSPDSPPEHAVIERMPLQLQDPQNYQVPLQLEPVASIQLVARLDGKSSLGRIGLLIHSTAGFIDPGFKGQVTLELSNVANLPIAIYPGMKIGQVSFYELTTPAEHPYGSSEAGSKYQGQSGPTASRIHHDF